MSGDRVRLSIIGGGGGARGGGTTFLGIFFKLLIKTVAFVLFEEVVFGDDSRLIFRFEGDLFIVGTGSSLMDGFWPTLFVVVAMGFFRGGIIFDGDDTTGSFFLLIIVEDGFVSCSAFDLNDGRGFDSAVSNHAG